VARNCGECLFNDVEIVQLREDGVCPRCGANYGPEVRADYPPGWPNCHCGRPVLDGHVTCGRAECNEGAVRRANETRRATP